MISVMKVVSYALIKHRYIVSSIVINLRNN